MSGPNGDRDWPPSGDDFERDLEPGLQGEERHELVSLAVRLAEQRPVPSAGLRSRIRSKLLGGRAAVPRSRIAGLIFGYAASGAVLLAIAAVGLAGIGPFAA
jgi:hypothetical protein